VQKQPSPPTPAANFDFKADFTMSTDVGRFAIERTLIPSLFEDLALKGMKGLDAGLEGEEDDDPFAGLEHDAEDDEEEDEEGRGLIRVTDFDHGFVFGLFPFVYVGGAIFCCLLLY
jgi:hypothetical protein